MNADQRRCFLIVPSLVFATILFCSTTQAEDVKYESLYRDFLQGPEAINLFNCKRLIPWTFALSQEWEEEQKEIKNGFDGFVIAKELNSLQLLVPGTSRRILVPALGKHVVKPFSWKMPNKDEDEVKAHYWSLLAHQRCHFFNERVLYA